jgi:hypothetical protein
MLKNLKTGVNTFKYALCFIFGAKRFTIGEHRSTCLFEMV